MKRRVLVTGASGFTGRHLSSALRAQGDHVIPVARATAPGSSDSVPCDLTDSLAVRELVREHWPTHVVHLAGIAHVAHADQEAYYRVNVLAATHLLDALCDAPALPQKVLLASSANIYGHPTNVRGPIGEDRCPAPVNHYACSKLAMEHMAWTYGHRLPIVVARPFNYTGPGQSEDFLVPKIVGHFRRRQPVIELGNLEVWRDFSDVRDIVTAYTQLLDGDASGITCNLCSGEATSLAEVVAILNRLAGYRIEVRSRPDLVRSNEIRVLVGDSARMQHYTRVVVRPFEETLQNMYLAE